jgi:hypothetical protein
VIGSVELLVRNLYYKFCHERKKYPVELKRRQPNKRKRLMREDEPNVLPMTLATQHGKHNPTMNDLDRLMHLWTNTTSTGITSTSVDYRDNVSNETRANQQHDAFQSPTHSSSGSSSSNSSSPESNPISMHHSRSMSKLEKFCPLNLSIATNTHSNLMCTE